MGNIVREVMGRQRAWALRRGVVMRAPFLAAKLEGNLFAPLSGAARAEFEEGDGDELAWKMSALHSSAALIVNVADHLRARPGGLALLAATLGLRTAATGARFEARLSVGLRGGRPAHLDLLLEAEGGEVLAVESKFLEPYRGHPSGFRPAYFARPEVFAGLPRVYAAAQAIHEGREVFRYLDAAQLIKHVLGLRRRYGRQGFTLIYLWYEVPGAEAAAHRAEIARFETLLGDEVRVRALTHQELYARLVAAARPEDTAYLAYLGERYFGAGVQAEP